VDPSQLALSMPGGTGLVMRTFRASESPRAAVIIPAAMGVAQQFYTQFAQWLAGQGFTSPRLTRRPCYASVRMPMLSLSFTDDEMMSARGIRSLHGLYTNAPVESCGR
jgi:predicted alpha/beta hydrolase